MDLQIALLLGQDGIVNGAIYGLMALALVLVFSVTRVIFIPQGEFVAFGALTMAMMQGGRIPSTLWLLVGLAAVVLAVEVVRYQRGSPVNWPATIVWCLVLPLVAAALILGLRPTSLGMQALTTLVLITPMGPLLYRLAFRPLAQGVDVSIHPLTKYVGGHSDLLMGAISGFAITAEPTPADAGTITSGMPARRARRAAWSLTA